LYNKLYIYIFKCVYVCIILSLYDCVGSPLDVQYAMQKQSIFNKKLLNIMQILCLH